MERVSSVADFRASACLSTDEALDFAQGRLSGARLETADAHVDACAECREVVIDALRGLNSGRAESSTPETTMFQRGMVVGERFRICRFIAQGGMGEVYEAFDLELDTIVALKTIATLVADNERAVRYLKSEVLNARRIAHPNVCRIYEWGTHVVGHGSSRVHFFTMEFIRGERLGALVRRAGPLSVERAIVVAHQLLSGLAAAHAAGILHRDFKSDNVMLTTTEGEPKAVILDFGLARPLDREPGSSSFGPVGTRPYMAPEQLEGEPLNPSADIYAFGVMLFEILTRRRPFESDDGTEPPLACLKKTPVAPSRFVSKIPAGLDNFVLRCLRRDSRERFQTAEQALAELGSLAPSFVERSSKPVLAAILPAAVIATSILLTAGYATLTGPRRSPTTSATDVLVRAPMTNPSFETAPPPPPRAPPPVGSASNAVLQGKPVANDDARRPVHGRKSSTPKPSRSAQPALSGPAALQARSAALVWEPFEGPSSSVEAHGPGEGRRAP